MQLIGRFPNEFRVCRKCVVSLIYNLISFTAGWSKKSINDEILSVGQTMGLPGDLDLLLCILGNI